MRGLIDLALCWVGLAGLVFLAGCGSGHPDTVPVSGTVTYQGNPVAGAQVTFMPQEGGARAGIGTTDGQGKYELTTFEENDGALPGKHSVTISMPVEGGDPGTAEDPTAAYGDMMSQAASGQPVGAPEGTIPGKYGAAKTSGLTAEVTPGDTKPIDFDLSP
jgi:hypothetical protein